MTRVAGIPRTALRGVVHSYWGMTRDLSVLGGFNVMPDTFVEVLFWGSNVYARDGAERRPLGNHTVLGPLLAPVRLEFEGELRCASIRLPAWSRRSVLAEGDATFADIVDPVTTALREADWELIWALFDRSVSVQLARRGRPCKRSLGRRQEERRTRAETSVSPLQLRNLARFERVLAELWDNPDRPLATLAAQHEYADQSHMTRQFRRYAGMTPTEYLAEAARVREWQKTEAMSQTSKTAPLSST